MGGKSFAPPAGLFFPSGETFTLVLGDMEVLVGCEFSRRSDVETIFMNLRPPELGRTGFPDTKATGHPP
jgi:hypothetical protein